MHEVHISLFDTDANVPTKGYFVVERSEQVTLVTDDTEDMYMHKCNLKDFNDDIGMLDDWADDNFSGFVMSVTDDVPKKLRDSVCGGDIYVMYVAPMYYVPTKAEKNYLLQETVDPFLYTVGVDCTPVN